MSGEKSKVRTIIIWFIIPWIILAILVFFVIKQIKSESGEELNSFINLKQVETEELLALDEKRALSEGVKYSENMPSFVQGTSDTGVLLIHGFTASPYEMSGLSQYLNDAGFGVYNGRVAGHGSVPDNLGLLTYDDWYESMKLGYTVLQQHYQKVYIAGQSMGALLAMGIAMENESDGLVLLSPALAISDPKFKAVSFAKYFVKQVKKNGFNEKYAHYYYNVRPMNGLDQLSRLMTYIRSNSAKLSIPVLVCQSVYDELVNVDEVVRYVEEKLSMADKELCLYQHNKDIKHILTLEENPEQMAVFGQVKEWLEERSHV